ncbi:MAG TPA: MBL fold metallo-hydrolase [Alphaproteobacteria bacterium]|nr:MBL fold metallo-hydrolase [Alphaproteobacteria bacterium]
MIVKKLEWTDVFAANCYFYIDEASKHGFVIDPSAHADELLNIIKKNNWQIEKILLTHSHLDHIGAAKELSNALNIQIFSFESSKKYLSNPTLSAHFTDFNVIKNMKPLKDGDIVSLKANPDISLKIIATPGHTIDSAIYYDSKNHIAFTGDTIFQSGIGRTDIEGSGGNYFELITNIKNKILTLPDNTVLYPGHGDQTTVQNEKSNF